MTTWGFIGSGNIGSTVAGLAVAAGHRVVMSNRRGPATLAGLVSALGPLATAGTPAQAADAGDIVVVTIPLGSYRDVPADAVAGKVVVDTMNYYPGRDGTIGPLADGTTTSSELVAGHLDRSDVVKGFNNIFYQHLQELGRPAAATDRSALPVAGDSTGAKATVTALLDAIGYDVVDLGALSEGWRSQPGQPVYGTPYAADPQDWTAGARPAGMAEIAAAAAAAVHG